MKIAHIFWSFTIGGAETMLVDIINKQVQNESVALFIINNQVSYVLLNELNPKVHVELIKRQPKNYFPWKLINLNLLLLKYNPEVIHCHNYTLDKVLLPQLLKKSILTVHGFNRQLDSKNKFRHIVAISQAVYNDLYSKGLRNLFVIHNGIEASSIVVKKKFNKEIKLVCVGRLEHEIKGQDILIRAFSLLKEKYPNTSLHFIGEGNSEKNLKKLAIELKVDNSIFFHGSQSRRNLYSSLQSYDILIQPSNYEGFGLSVVEAMAAKLPVLISNATGLVEITNNGKFAHIAKEQSEYEYFQLLHAMILKINNLEQELLQLIDSAKKYANDNFSIEKTCSSYKKVYQTTCMLNIKHY